MQSETKLSTPSVPLQGPEDTQSRPQSINTSPLCAPLPDFLKDWTKVTSSDAADRLTWLAAWRHFSPFLQLHGYHLYFTEAVNPERPSVTRHEADSYPLAREPFEPQPYEALVHSVYPYPATRRFIQLKAELYAAYDRYHREVYIKAVRSTSDELRVIRFLTDPARRSDPRNHTVPVLDVLPFDQDWTFVVMASWGAPNFAPSNIWEYLEHARQSLEGVSFMHSVSIAHRDISSSHILINHRATSFSVALPVLDRRALDIRLGFIDFGLSTLFPANVPLDERLVHGRCGTAPHWAPEVESCSATGTYNPFSADVHALGSVLHDYFHNLVVRREMFAGESCALPSFHAENAVTEHLPQFLHLLDRMMSQDPAQRPTADEALAEIVALQTTESEEVLLLPRGKGVPIDHSERLAAWLTVKDRDY